MISDVVNGDEVEAVEGLSSASRTVNENMGLFRDNNNIMFPRVVPPLFNDSLHNFPPSYNLQGDPLQRGENAKENEESD